MPLLTLPEAGSLALSVRAKALVFEDPGSQALLERMRQIAPSRATVLITGETGTGKELAARHIHELSRPGRPFIAVNCGAFSESLVESELFGHERGAFTGAISSKAGWFEAARGGTLFLDEIGDLPLQTQVKLLRVLQENEVVRLGSRQPTPIDVRLIAATNVNLEDAVAAGRFREDLYYRLNVAGLSLKPLRERPGDILPLARHFLKLYAGRLGIKEVSLSRDAEKKLVGHSWPGNIRELENAVHHALLVCQGGRVEASDLRLTTLQPRAASSPPPAPPCPAAGLEQALLDLFEQGLPNLHEHVSRALIVNAYRFCDNNQLQTARLLGISRNIVRARLIEYGEIAGTPRSARGAELVDSSAPPTSSASNLGGTVRPLRASLTVRIGYQKFGLLMFAKGRGALDEALARRGVAVEWREYPGGTQLIEALASGGLALGIVGEGPPILAHAARVPIVYVAAETSAPESEAIVVRPSSPVRCIADLRGKVVALNRGSNVHYLLIRALEEVGVGYDEVDVRYLAPNQARVAFERGEVDAWGIWDPALAEVQHSLGARVLRNASGLAVNPAYYVATREFAEAHPEIVDVFLAELAETARFISARPGEASELLAPRLGLSKLALTTAILRNPHARLVASSEIGSQQEVADAFFKLNVIPHPITVPEARWSSPSWMRAPFVEGAAG
jgi:aliphatic sulfonates family ABC transporter substrate-binding protein